jgi:hypothetical protein
MDEGFVGNCWQLYQWQNEKHITVLNAGGYGHVSIPLLKQPEPALLPKIPPGERQHVVSYVGSVGGMTGSMREKMLEPGYYYYLGDEWRDVTVQSKSSLCPQGVGRTSFHVFESLHMGLIPIQVYEDEDKDEPWLPYGDLINNVSFTVTVSELQTFVEKLSMMSDSEVKAMEANIDDLRNVYFSFDGVLREIGKFMLGGMDGDDESK